MVASHEEVERNEDDEALLELIKDQYQDMLSNNVIWPQPDCISLDVERRGSHGGFYGTRENDFDENGTYLVPAKRGTGRLTEGGI